MSTLKTPEQRYREKLRYRHGLPCIDWGARIDKYGNAVFTYTDTRKHTVGAHRFGWELVHGPIPEGHKLENICGLPSCQNPDHWKLKSRNLELTVFEKYETKFTKRGDEECWDWQEKSRDKNSYGIFSYRTPDGGHVTVRATRYGWEQQIGEIPEGMFVCHTCDNPPCMNPKHWFLGNVRQNNADMMKKGRGRWVSGENHYTVTIPDSVVAEIRSRYTGTHGEQTALAEEYGVDRRWVCEIVAGHGRRLPSDPEQAS